MDSNSSPTEIVLIVALILAALSVLILSALFRRPHEQNLELWARENNLKILNLQPTDRAKTPFSFLTTWRSESFYRIKVLTAEGIEKSGFVCVAGQMSAFFTPKARAVWDDEKRISQKSV